MSKQGQEDRFRMTTIFDPGALPNKTVDTKKYAPLEMECIRNELTRMSLELENCKNELTLAKSAHWQRGAALEILSTEAVPMHLQSTAAVDARKSHQYFDVSDARKRCTSDRQLDKKTNRLQHLATHDELTQLPNRRLFNQSLTRFMASAQRGKHKLGVALLDLDEFKSVNDTMGHDIGDELLLAVAQRLTKAVGPNNFVARLAGDEFTLIIRKFRNQSELTNLFDNVRLALSQPFLLHNATEVRVSASIGGSVYPTDGLQPKELLKCADAAMYEAKSSGRNCTKLFTQDMGRALRRKLRFHRELRSSLDNNEFETWYQPIYNCSTGSITNVEALVRWRHPERGLLSANDFVGLADDCGAIEPLGSLIMEGAFQQQNRLKKSGYRYVTVSINISDRQIVAPNFVEEVEELLHKHKTDATRIEFQLTEQALSNEISAVTDAIRSLRSLGIQFSIDNFGTGYSSCTRLAELPINKVKIGQSIIRKFPNDKDSISIVNALMAMGKNLNCCVAAVGVETHEQLNALQSAGCDEVQGFLLAMPSPQNRLLSTLGSYNDLVDRSDNKSDKHYLEDEQRLTAQFVS